eukprot:TRINITY_DN8439_c0_g1_i1.p1 TRINITY_DN8439_c0_g1~~TRINITY_DN8439_c0_g1_i1.p1  ORF type:complete len:57 (+),score=4.04 TRINITY_DN8439_c0_g1_i1:382-552(+)
MDSWPCNRQDKYLQHSPSNYYIKRVLSGQAMPQKVPRSRYVRKLNPVKDKGYDETV